MVGSVKRFIIVVAALALAFAAPLAGAASGGGSVSNRLPTVVSLTATAGNHNKNQAYEFSGQVDDRNREGDFVEISVSFQSSPGGAAALPSARAIVAGDLTQTTEPSFGSDNWKIWNTDANDGVLNYKFRYTYTVIGDYTFRVSVRDEGALQFDAAKDLSRTVVAKITFSANPFASDGTELTGTNWGGWTADPGATNVQGQNFFKVTNTGATAAQQFTLSFDAVSFTGTNGETIAINNNIQFAVFEDTTPSGSTPADGGTYTCGASDADGAVTLTFSGLGNIYYIKYCLASIPQPLKDQAYTATFTVDAL